MKRPLCLFIEIHRGKLKTFAPSPRRMRRRHIAARPLESSTFTRQLGKKEKSKKKKKDAKVTPLPHAVLQCGLRMVRGSN